MQIQKQEARELYLKSKIYRIVAIIFAIVGLGLFGQLYFKQYNGDLAKALSDPFFIVTILFPFLPAIILSLISTRLEKKVVQYLQEPDK